MMEGIEGFKGLRGFSRGGSAVGRVGSAVNRGRSSLSRGRAGLSRGRSAPSRGKDKVRGFFSSGKDKIKSIFKEEEDRRVLVPELPRLQNRNHQQRRELLQWEDWHWELDLSFHSLTARMMKYSNKRQTTLTTTRVTTTVAEIFFIIIFNIKVRFIIARFFVS